MPSAAMPSLEPGRVYRTRDFLPWGKNAARLAQRLVQEGVLRQLRQGVFETQKVTKFGPAPADDRELVRAYLGSDDFVFSGSPYWNALGLGATGVQAVTVVYNRKRTVEAQFGTRRFHFSRVSYPSTSPPPEWFAIDLLRHCAEAGVGRDEVLAALVVATRSRRLDVSRLLEMAEQFARRGTVAMLKHALAAADVTA